MFSFVTLVTGKSIHRTEKSVVQISKDYSPFQQTNIFLIDKSSQIVKQKKKPDSLFLFYLTKKQIPITLIEITKWQDHTNRLPVIIAISREIFIGHTQIKCMYTQGAQLTMPVKTSLLDHSSLHFVVESFSTQKSSQTKHRPTNRLAQEPRKKVKIKRKKEKEKKPGETESQER